MWVKYEIDKLKPEDLDVTVKRYNGQKTLLHELIDSDKYIIFDFFKDVPTPLGTVNKVIVKIKYPLDSLGQPTDFHYTQAFRSYLWRCQKTYRNDLDFFQFASETAWMLMGDCEDSSILTGAGLELLKAIDICDYFIAFGKVFKKDIFLGYHGWVIMKVDGIWRLCLTPDVQISGDFKPIENIHIGENVFGQSGTTKVTQTFKRYYRGEIVEIKGEGLIPIKLTPEHPVMTIRVINRGGGRRIVQEPVWKKAEDVIPYHAYFERKSYKKKVGDYLIIPRIKGELHITEIPLSPYTTEHGRRTARGIGIPIHFPLNKDTAWLLGLYVADGSACDSRICIYLSPNDKEIINKFERVAEVLGYKPNISEYNGVVYCCIYSRMLGRALKEWCGDEARSKRVPPFIIHHANDEIVSSFLRGFFDGDGCFIERPRKILSGTTTSRTLALQLQLLFARLGGLLNITHYKPHDKFIIRSSNAIVLEKIGYKKNIRPYDYIVTERYIAVPVRYVRKYRYEGWVYNLETTDKTYLANNVLVHNCETTLDTPYANIHEIPQIDISTNKWTVGDITYEALLLFNKKWLWEWSEGVSLSPSGDIVNPSVKTPKSTLEHYLEKTHKEKENKKKYKEMSESYTKLMGKSTKVK